MNPTLKITEEAADAIRARIKSFDFKGAIDTDEKVRKAKEDNGSFDVIISTDDLDRSGEIVKQEGWDFTNYKNNPIVLWGHDYYSLPIGMCTNIQIEGNKTRAQGVFLSADINPLAQQVRKLYEFGVAQGRGVGCTTSVGFIPKEFDQNNSSIITRAELLEFSFVPIPANQGVGPAVGRSLTFAEAKAIGLDLFAMRAKGVVFVDKEPPETKSKKEAELGDSCTTDDGSPGILTTDPKDPEGALVCLPQESDKIAPTPSGDEPMNEYEKSLHKAIDKEHDRHDGAVKDAIDDFKTKCKAVVEDQPDENDEKKKDAQDKEPKENTDDEEGEGASDEGEHTVEVAKHVKALKEALSDEHDFHRATNTKAFRSFEPPEEKKSFEIEKHLKALKAEHEKYETKCGKAMDEFETKCKTIEGEPGEVDEHTDWLIGKMIGHQTDHREKVKAIATKMTKGMGEEETEEKTIDLKVGAKLSVDTKKKLEEAHEHLMKGIAIVRALHGGLGKEDGEEEEEEHDQDTSENKELKNFIVTRDLGRAFVESLHSMLSESNNIVKTLSRQGKK